MATPRCAGPNLSPETLGAARKDDFSCANVNRFKAVAGRPLKSVAKQAEQGNRGTEEAASQPDLALAAAGRTARPSGEASKSCALAIRLFCICLTFDMRGG